MGKEVKMLPIIGMTSSRKLIGDNLVDATERFYIKAIEESQGIPFILPSICHHRIRSEAFSMIDGLLLTGDSAQNPLLDNKKQAMSKNLDQDKEDFEISIARYALKNRLPVLGICCGLQTLVLAAGGKFYEHLSIKNMNTREDIRLYGNNTSSLKIHPIYLCAHTKLMSILNREIILVVSRHLHPIEEMPQGFMMSAYAEDGVIEAIEINEKSYFCLGVHFNSERMLDDPLQKKLFKAFVQAASTYHLARQHSWKEKAIIS